MTTTSTLGWLLAEGPRIEELRPYDTLYILKGFYYSHLPELGDDDDGNGYWCGLQSLQPSDLSDLGLQSVVHYFHNFDGRRYHRLASVWWEGQPAMVVQNAGREGDDFYKRFIISEDLVREIATQLHKKIPLVSSPPLLETPLDQHLPELFIFYGEDARTLVGRSHTL